MTVEELGPHLAKAAEFIASGDLREPLVECRGVLLQDVRDNFTSSADPKGGSWPARKEPGDGHPLLMDQGPLVQAATGGGPGSITRIAPRSLECGVDKDVIAYAGHDHGFPEKNIPARPYMGMSDDGEVECAEILADFILEKAFG